MNMIEAKAALEYYISKKIPAFLWGAPGVGKSALVSQVAASMGRKLIDERAVLLDPVDLRGVLNVVDGRAVWAIPDWLPREDRDGPEGIFFLDEFNAAPASVQAAFLQLVWDRKIGGYVLPAGWDIVGAGNRQSDRAYAQRMGTAMNRRFGHVDIDPDLDAWQAWANSVSLEPLVCAFLKFKPALLHKMDTGADVRSFPNPASWELVARVCDAPEAVRMALVSGLVGQGAAAEFEGFVKTWRGLPSIAQILRDPMGADVPSASEPGIQYALAGVLARKADRANLANVMTYLKRLPKEFEVLAVTEMTKRDSGLKETSAYIAWTMQNKDVAL